MNRKDLESVRRRDVEEAPLFQLGKLGSLGDACVPPGEAAGGADAR